jgi:RNA polymerase sigma-70 factor (ECF subfamily)
MEPSVSLAGVRIVGMSGSTGTRLEEFYPPAYQRLVGALVVMGVPQHAAVDAAQEAFVRLIPRWEKVRDYDQPHSWLRTVAWRVWLNDRRRTRHLSDASVPDRATAPDDPTDHEDLLAALAELPEGQREVVVLHYLTDLPVGRVAQELGIAEGTVKSRLSRARAQLAQALRLQEVSDE